jgi:hypothetical protein
MFIFVSSGGDEQQLETDNGSETRLLRRTPMKTIIASIIALGLFAGAASATVATPTQADNSVTGYCAPYYGD